MHQAIVLVSLCALAMADVSHLSHSYLPPSSGAAAGTALNTDYVSSAHSAVSGYAASNGLSPAHYEVEQIGLGSSASESHNHAPAFASTYKSQFAAPFAAASNSYLPPSAHTYSAPAGNHISTSGDAYSGAGIDTQYAANGGYVY